MRPTLGQDLDGPEAAATKPYKQGGIKRQAGMVSGSGIWKSEVKVAAGDTVADRQEGAFLPLPGPCGGWFSSVVLGL